MNKHANVLEKDSSVIITFNYDQEEETLTIRFRSGATYEYYDVPENTYYAFVQADSLGEFFNSEIKGTYPYCRVR